MLRSVLFLISGLVFIQLSFAQRRLTEATLHYTVETAQGDSATQALLQGVRYTCYIKGVNSRMELESPMGKESTLLLGKTGQAILMKDYGTQHYLTKMTAAQWQQMNQVYEDATLKISTDTLRINGFLCNKAHFQFRDGTSRAVWFTTQVVPIYREFQLFAKKVPGLLVQYETTLGNTAVIFKLKELNYNPVQVALFDVPEDGYRIIEWEEIEKTKGN